MILSCSEMRTEGTSWLHLLGMIVLDGQCAGSVVEFWAAVAVQVETSDPFPPQAIGGNIGLGEWVSLQRRRKKGAKGKPALSKAEEEQVGSLHHALS